MILTTNHPVKEFEGKSLLTSRKYSICLWMRVKKEIHSAETFP
jgi:hypothetical protein